MNTESPPNRAGPPAVERRKDERVVARIDVRFQESSEAARAFRAYSLNLSVGGLCLRTRKRYDVGAQLQLALTVEGQEYSLLGVVAWERSGAIGVRFDRVDPEDRKRLTDLVARYRERTKAMAGHRR
jgi:uncharacterized protein (TIGR02266 family)